MHPLMISSIACTAAERKQFSIHFVTFLIVFFSTFVFTSTDAIAQNVTDVKIGSGTLDSNRTAGPRWMRVNFSSLASDTHIIRVAWDNDSDFEFVVRHRDGTLISPTVSGSNPVVWTGELDAGERYYLGVRANSGTANFTATINLEPEPEPEPEPESPADPPEDNDTSPVSSVTFGQGILDSSRAAGPRFIRLYFDSLDTAVHTINVSWDSNADVRFNVFDESGSRVNGSVVRGSNPGVWIGQLDANQRYNIGLWSFDGIANYTATLTVRELSAEEPAPGKFSQQADAATWILDGPAPTLDFNTFGPFDDGWGRVLLRVDDLLLVGGDFTGIRRNRTSSTTQRPWLAALDAVSGQPVSTFQVPLQIDSVVRSLALSPNGNQVYVGGDFGLLVIDAITGQLDFAVSVTEGNGQGRVFDIAVSQTQIYIGGEFNNVEGTFRHNIARLSLDGDLDGSWRPNAQGGFGSGREAPVQSVSLSPSGDSVYVGGNFTAIDGIDVARSTENTTVSMLVLDADEGAAVRPERFTPIVDRSVTGSDSKPLRARDIAVTENYVIIAWGGPNHLTFHSLDGTRLRQYRGTGDVQALQVMGDLVFVGHHGEFFGDLSNPIPLEAVLSINPEIIVQFKLHSFRLDDPDFQLDQAWEITGPFGVWGIAASEDSIWVSGQLSTAGSDNRAIDGLVRFPVEE